MKKTIFNSIEIQNVHGNVGEKSFDFNYLNAIGFTPLTKTQKIFSIFEKLECFEDGKKPLVKKLVQGKNNIYFGIDKNNFFVHVITENGETFTRKTPNIKNTVKQFRAVKAMLRHFSKKKDIAKSNILQTRICHVKVNF